MVAGELPTTPDANRLESESCFEYGAVHTDRTKKRDLPLRSIHLAQALFREGVFTPPFLAGKIRSARTHSSAFADMSVALTATTTRISIHSSSRIDFRQTISPAPP